MEGLGGLKQLTLVSLSHRFVRIGLSSLIITNILFILISRYFLLRAKKWAHLTQENARNLFVYAGEILVTTVAFGLSLPMYHAIFIEPLEFLGNTDLLDLAAIILGLLGGVYLGECIFKPNIGWPLAFHHLSTVCLGCYTVVFLEELIEDKIFEAVTAVLGSVCLMSLTDQFIFLGMIWRRLGSHTAAAAMFMAALLHTLLLKMGIGIYTIVQVSKIAHSSYSGCEYGASKFFLVCVPILFALLLVAQLYIARIYIALYRSSVAKSHNKVDLKTPPSCVEIVSQEPAVHPKQRQDMGDEPSITSQRRVSFQDTVKESTIHVEQPAQPTMPTKPELTDGPESLPRPSLQLQPDDGSSALPAKASPLRPSGGIKCHIATDKSPEQSKAAESVKPSSKASSRFTTTPSSGKPSPSLLSLSHRSIKRFMVLPVPGLDEGADRAPVEAEAGSAARAGHSNAHPRSSYQQRRIQREDEILGLEVVVDDVSDDPA